MFILLKRKTNIWNKKKLIYFCVISNMCVILDCWSIAVVTQNVFSDGYFFFLGVWWEQHYTKYLKCILWRNCWSTQTSFMTLLTISLEMKTMDKDEDMDAKTRFRLNATDRPTVCVCVCVHCVDVQQVVIGKLNCLVINRRCVKTSVVENKTEWNKKRNVILFIKWISKNVWMKKMRGCMWFDEKYEIRFNL